MHVPGYIEKLPELRKKGVDIVAVIAFNDAFVMSAWGKINGMKDEDMVSRDIPLGFLPSPGCIAVYGRYSANWLVSSAVHGGYGEQVLRKDRLGYSGVGGTRSKVRHCG